MKFGANDRVKATGGGEGSLNPQQGFLLSLADGKLSVEELIQAAPMDDRAVLDMIAELLDRGFLEKISFDPAVSQYRKLLRVQESLVTEDDDLYRVLGLKSGAKSAEVKQAFIKLSKRYHPDRIPRGLRDDAKLVERTEALYEAIQRAHDILLSPESKKQWARERLNKQRGGPITKEEEQTANTAATQDGLKPETLIRLAREAISNGEYKAALTNLRMARKISGGSAEIDRLTQDAEKKNKLIVFIEKLENSLELSESERAKVETAIEQYKSLWLGDRRIIARLIKVVSDLNVSKSIFSELFHQLALGTMTAEQYLLGAKFYRQRNMISTAMETAEAGLEVYPKDQDLRKIARDLKREK